MDAVTRWTVEVELAEDGDMTRADAYLQLGDQRLHGWGQSRRSPSDPNVPVIGEELATARALTDLAHQLIHAAVDSIEQFEGKPVAVHH